MGKTKRWQPNVIGALIVIMVVAVHEKLLSQTYDNTPIGSKDYEMGVNNLDHIRPILLEKGFKLGDTDSQSEYWKVLISVKADPRRVLGTEKLVIGCQVQLSSWNNGNKEFGRMILVQIRRDLLPKYAQGMTDEVRSYFPEKKAVPISLQTEGVKEKSNYTLVYYRKDSKVTVEFEEDETWTKFFFRLDLLSGQ